MINDLVGTVTTQGNIDQSNAIECSFDAAGTAHLMSILTNLYSDAPLAVLREYSVNAYDSHIAAGQTRPIEVWLPTQLKPTLEIRDFGVGLSRDEIVNIYSKYGASTKRETNEQVGAFGVGSKAAFTIGSQFVVTGVKDGTKTTALFALGSNGVGTVNVLSEEPTDEDNGVLVSIGISQIRAIKDASDAFFASWNPGTALVNSEVPKSIWDTSEKITDDLYAYTTDNGSANFIIVMGNVGYKVSSAILAQLRNQEKDAHVRKTLDTVWGAWKKNLIVKVPIGSVDITPSREDLRDTPKTLGAIRSIVADATEQIKNKLEASLNSQTNLFDAAMKLKEIYNSASADLISINVDSLRWNGTKINSRVDLANTMSITKESGRYGTWRLHTSSKSNAILNLWNYDPEKTIVITSADINNLRAVKYRMRQYMIEKEIDRIYVMQSFKGSQEWFKYDNSTSMKTYNVNQWRAEVKKLPRAPRSAASKTTYKVYYNGDDSEMSVEEILDSGEEVLYSHNQSYGWLTNGYFAEAAKDKLVVVVDGRKKPEVFLKNVPEAILIKDVAKELAKKALDAIKPEEIEEYTLGQWYSHTGMYTNILKELPRSEIQAKSVMEYIDRSLQQKQASITTKSLVNKLHNIVQTGLDIPKMKSNYQEPTWQKDYPLLSVLNNASWLRNNSSVIASQTTMKKHLVDYINYVNI